MSQTVGRNDPCPCGSGKKYKRCCLNQDRAAGSAVDVSSIAGAGGAANELRMMLEGQQFSSQDEANAFLDQITIARNQRGIADFLGLSSEQIHRFLHFPFESPQYVVFPEVLDAEPDAPLMTLFSLIVDAMGDQGLKATATGNLPRTFCREAFDTFKATGFYDDGMAPRGINTELDFTELHEVRTIAELAHLIVLDNKHFVLTEQCKKLLSEHGNAAIYPLLFRTFCRGYNWGYLDGYAEASIVQMSFIFSLYMLKQQGSKQQPHTQIAEAFLKAFPMLIDEFESRTHSDSHSQAIMCYTQRALRGFCRLSGVAKVKSTSGSFFDRQYTVRPLPLLRDAVRFQGPIST